MGLQGCVDGNRMPWAQEFTRGPCGAMLGWQGFTGTPVSALRVSASLLSAVNGFPLGRVVGGSLGPWPPEALLLDAGV